MKRMPFLLAFRSPTPAPQSSMRAVASPRFATGLVGAILSGSRKIREMKQWPFP